MTDRFVNLHRHDCFSFFDGLCLPSVAVERVVELGQPALGVTNHGVVYGLVEHDRECRSKGVKPILGCEVYVTESLERVKGLRHMTVLVESSQGYKNLMRLVELGQQQFYYKPRLTLEDLEMHQDGLLLLTGCPSGVVSRKFFDSGHQAAREALNDLVRRFHGRLWVEVQANAHFDARLASFLVEAAGSLRVPVVATVDSHYAFPEDKVVHDLLLSMRTEKQGETSPTYGDGFHVLSRAEAEASLASKYGVWADSRARGSWLDETVRIADRVDFKFERPAATLPDLWPDGRDRLRAMAARGMVEKKLYGKLEYVQRLRRELDVIEKLGYVSYFHVCSEVTTYARESGIMVGPRGSVCGSLLAYVLGITRIDPLVHGTQFERFLHEGKKTMPDVDLDIDSEHREELVSWILKRYEPHAVPICTFGRYSAISLANDLSARYELDDRTAAKLKEVLNRIKREDRLLVVTKKDLEKYSFLDDLEEKIPEIKQVVTRLYSAVRYVGKHPGGVVFVPEDNTKWFAKVQAGEGKTVACYNMFDLESLGLLKFDFLGLASLSAVTNACRMIELRHGERVDLDAVPLDDSAVLTGFASGKTDGVFQFETDGGRSILREIEPDTFLEVAIATALNRPGVSQNIRTYVDRKGGRQDDSQLPEAVRVIFDRAVRDTYGAIIFQEQISQIIRDVGLTWSDADQFNKSIKSQITFANWQDEAKGAPMLQKFYDRLVVLGMTAEEAVKFIDRISLYSFNKAHAVGYAWVAWVMMWLKIRYPMEFWCALLGSEVFDDKRRQYESAASRDGIILLPPHVNGTAGYSVEDNAIRVGLSSLKGVGEIAASEIEKNRPYVRPQDIQKCDRRKVNAKVIKILAEVGALTMDRGKLIAAGVQYNESRRSERSRAR